MLSDPLVQYAIQLSHLDGVFDAARSPATYPPYSLWRSHVAWFIGQSLPTVLASFILGLLVGWFVWGSRKASPSTVDGPSVAAGDNDGAAVVAVPLHAEAVPRDVRPLTMDLAGPAERDQTPPDDLERIEGIGPKMAAALRTAGIRTFAQLADSDDNTRRAAIEAAGLTFAPSLVTWGRQARLLADGDEDAFVELTERLVAGRETGRA
ncbi:helix-hairpin-helix domain-containing protein [Micromonospora sp. NPDC050397]|uniref:helix-hairpin-helix domain-containing protein n=1 Tax=Micromonospora sp. NPDC050397 TaxID=3364279 RepID=UPI00384EEA7C